MYRPSGSQTIRSTGAGALQHGIYERAATDRMQDLRQVGFHARAFSGREDDGDDDVRVRRPVADPQLQPRALAALRRAGILRVRATVALSGPRVSRPLFAAAERLCPQVRHLVVDVPGEGEELAAWLREP